MKRLFSLREKITCRQVLEQQLVQQERRQQQERLGRQQEQHLLEQLQVQVLAQRQVLGLALLLLFYRKRLKLLQKGLRVRGRVIFSFG